MIAGSASNLSYTNPVFDGYFADPFAFQVGDGYYAVGTGGTDPGNGRVFQVLYSPNLIDWTSLGFALPKLPGMENDSYWAPEVVQRNGTYYMYYSVGQGDKSHHLRIASSPTPEGPYVDLGRLTSEQIPFAIDPHVYRHTDGEDYLFYASDRLESDRPGTCLYVDHLLSPTQVAGKPALVAHATSDWQRYEANRTMYGGTHDWHTLEGPTVIWNQGFIYVLYSGGNWQTESYGVDFVVSEHPLGPYENGTKERPRVLSATSGNVLGPGHNSIVRGPGKDPLVAVYHGWDRNKTARLMRIDPLKFGPDGPFIEGPTTDPKSL